MTDVFSVVVFLKLQIQFEFQFRASNLVVLAIIIVERAKYTRV